MKNKGTQFLTEAAVIGAIYVVLTLLFAPLSYGEILVKPLQENRLDLVQAYADLFKQIVCLSIDTLVAQKFAALRAEHKLKAPDALQLAAAHIGGASAFITNDERLTRYSSPALEIHTLDSVLSRYGA